MNHDGLGISPASSSVPAPAPSTPSEPQVHLDIPPAMAVPMESAPEPEEEFAPLAAMPTIAVFSEDEPVEEPAPANPLPSATAPAVELLAAGHHEIPQPAPGIEVTVDPGWTPTPGGLVGVLPSVPSVPEVPSMPVLPSVDIEELADEDVSPESDHPEPTTPPRPAPVLSTPPKPPPPPPGSTPAPPRVEVAPKTEEVEVDVTDDLAPLSTPVVEPMAAKPPPPPAVVPPPPPAVVPPPPPQSAPGSGPKLVEARPAAPKQPADKKRARPWWEEMFDDDFLRSIKQPTNKQIEEEVRFIDDRLGLRQDALILDLACGDGRHATGLTRRGYKVVGFDLSLAMMARAQEEAEAARQKINFLHGDMREMSFENQFDGVYFWGMSFGYFDEEKNFSVIQRIHRALRPGGVLLMDVCNRDHIAPRQPNMVWFEGEGCICMDETNLDSITSRLKIKRTVMLEDGRTRELDFSIRLYGLHELGKVLHEAGFKVLEVSGQIATPGVFFGSESPRCIILAERS